MHSQEDLKCLCIMPARIKQAEALLSPGAQTYNKRLLGEITKRKPTDPVGTAARSGRGEAALALLAGAEQPVLTSTGLPVRKAGLRARGLQPPRLCPLDNRPLGQQRIPT